MSNHTLDAAITALREVLNQKSMEIVGPLAIAQTQTGSAKDNAGRHLFLFTVSVATAVAVHRVSRLYSMVPFI